MARDTCPGCGASWNGKRCRACNYEHFSEEIAHGGHTHRGEPLVIDAPVRKPIPRKDSFGCDPRTRKDSFPRQERKPRPFLGLLTIFLLIYSFLPLVRDWGLELEAREEAVRMEQSLPEDLVPLHEEGPITVSTQPRFLNEFPDSGLRLWVENERKDSDVYLTTKYVMANGFVLPNTALFMECSADSICLDTLYLNDENLRDAGIDRVRELSFVLECLDENYTTLFETDPITITREFVSVPPEPEFDGTVLIDDGQIRMLDLSGEEPLKYENGWLLFYVENNTDQFLTMNSLYTTLGGEAVDLFLWCGLPPKSRAVVRMDLVGLEKPDFTTQKEPGNLEMTLQFWDPKDSSSSVKEYTLTISMANTEPAVIS